MSDQLEDCADRFPQTQNDGRGLLQRMARDDETSLTGQKYPKRTPVSEKLSPRAALRGGVSPPSLRRL